MSSLYELKNEYKILKEMMEDDSIDDDIISNTMEGIEYELEIKADNYAKIMKELEGEAETIKKEIARLDDKYSRIKDNVKRLKDNLQQAMVETGKTKIKTDLFTISVQKNGGVLPLVLEKDVLEIPDEYTTKLTRIDSDKVRKALENGEKLDFAHFGERGESLRIK